MFATNAVTLVFGAALFAGWVWPQTRRYLSTDQGWALVTETVRIFIVVAFGMSCAALALHAWAWRRAHRVRTATAAPIDPLATYRDGPPTECPRHPFAR